MAEDSNVIKLKTFKQEGIYSVTPELMDRLIKRAVVLWRVDAIIFIIDILFSDLIFFFQNFV